jgi:hypothetical protein
MDRLVNLRQYMEFQTVATNCPCLFGEFVELVTTVESLLSHTPSVGTQGYDLPESMSLWNSTKKIY